MLLSGINCLGQIEGVTFQDLSGDGVLDAGDTRLSNATHGVVVHLFEAGLDGVFDSAGSSGVAVNDDVFIDTQLPDANGSYDFNGLAAGTYFAEQPTPAGFIQRAGATVSGPITISLAEAAGTAGQLIDAFDEPSPAQSLTADNASTMTSSSNAGLTNVLGGERDLFVQRTGGTLDIDLEANSPPGFLNYNANFFTTGLGRVVWDGVDGASTVATTGLGSEDLTNGGTDAGFVLEIGGNTTNATLDVTLYTGTGVVTESVPIPNTGAASTQSVFIPFSDFVTADLTDVGAVEMTINAPDAATTVLVSEFRTQSFTTKTANFVNYLPMTLGGTIFDDADNSSTFESGTEATFNTVALTLFADEGNGVFDGTETQLNTTGSVAGNYAFTNLFPGDYIVRIDASNFGPGGALLGRESSTGAIATDPDDDVNNDDNGTHLGAATTAIVSQAITLINNSEVAVDGDADANTNFSLDFGVFGRTNITVDKNGPATVIAGSGVGNLVYTIDVTNTSGIDATGVTMTDAMLLSLPAGVTFVSTSLPAEFNAGTAVWNIGNLAAGATEQITITLTVGATAAESLQLTNTAVVAANQLETNPNDNDDTIVTDIDRRINITVDKNGPATVIAGSAAGNLVYTIDVTNEGPSNATGVTMTDALLLNLPAGVSFVSTSLPAEFNTGTSVWNIGDLAAGATEQITVTLTVDQTASDSLQVTNVSVVAANEIETNLTDNDDTVITDIDRRINITVDKNGPAAVTAGSAAGNLVYTIDVTNDGPSNATGVIMTDALLLNLPAGVSFVSTSLPAEFNTGTSVWNIGDLAAGATEQITVTLTVDQTASDSLLVTNVSVVAANETETNPNDNDDTVVTDIDRLINITVDKNGPATVIAGSGTGNLVYTIDVTNDGPSNATGVIMTDPLLLNLPAGVSFVSTSLPAEFNIGSAVWNIGNLAAGATEQFTVTLTVDQSASDSLQVTNVSVVAANETETNPNDNDDTVVTDIDRRVNITVDKSGPATVIGGSGAGNLVYTIDVLNDGPSNATGVTMTDALLLNLPAGVTFVSTSLPAEFNTGTAVWNIGDLAAGALETITVTLTVDGTVVNNSQITNVSVVGVTEIETNTTDNDDTVVTTVNGEINITVDKNGPATVIAGSAIGNLMYTIDVTNAGTSDATGVTMADALLLNLPAGVSFVSTDRPTEFNGTTAVWNVGDLAIGATERITVTLTVDATASETLQLTNVSVVAANEPESNLTDNDDAVVTNIDRQINLSVDKNGPATVIAGSAPGNLVYTIDVTNDGPSNATGVTMSDALLTNLPAGVSLASTSLPAEFNATTGVWTIGNLASGATERLTVNLTVNATASDSLNLTNISVVAANETEVTLADNTDTVVTNIDRQINLTVDKNGPATVIAGSNPGNLVYTIDVTNAGPSNATGVTMSDALLLNLPAGVTFVSTSLPAEFNTNTAVWNIGHLAAGATERITITATAAAATAIPQLTNVSIVAANEPETSLTDNSDTVVTSVDRQVNIRIGKTAPLTVVAGDGAGNLVYTVTATNTGPATATGVSVRDQMLTGLPAGIVIDSAIDVGGGSYNSGTGIWTVGSLTANEVRTLTVVLTVDGTVTVNSLTNIATLNAVDQTDNNPADNSSTTVTTLERVVDLVVQKNDLVDPIRSPGVIQYEIIVTNNGPSTATNVVVTDVLSPQVTFVSVTETQGTSQNASGIVITDIGTLASGATATITLIVNANVPNGGTVTNVVMVEANETTTPSTDSEPTLVLPGFGAISGVVFEDLNDNGLPSAGEPGIPGTTLLLFGVENGTGTNVVRRQITDASGAYLFGELAPGTYNVVELQPGIFTEGRDSEEGVVLNNSNQTDVISNIQVGAQQVRPLRNFGEGERDESKRDFLASNQVVGQIVQPTLPLQVTGNGSIQGFVAVDNNANGVFDAGDSGIPAAIVTLIGTDNAGNAVLISQATDTDGSYSFTGLPAGTYSISESQPAAYLDGPEQAPTTGSVLPDSVLDDLFSLIALPDSAVGMGFNFLERVSNGVTVPANQAPVLAAQSVQGTSQPVLTWQPVAGSAAYDVWVNQLSGGGGVVYRNPNVAGTSLKVPVDLRAGEHMLWVRAIRADGTAGPWSQPQRMNVSPAPTMLSPNSVTADTTPAFNFSDVSGAESYDLMVQDMQGRQVIAVEQLASSQYTGTTQLPIGTYRAFTRARMAGVAGSWSEGTEFSIRGAPQLVNPVSASTLAPVLLEWSDSGAAEYEVWVNETTGGTRRVAIVQKATGTAILLSNEPAGNYKFWVRGLDAEGVATSWSSPQSFDIFSAGQVISPTGSTSGINPTITWKPVSGATHYDVWVAGSSGMVARELNATGTSHTFDQTLADGGYRVWVKPIGMHAAGSWSTAARFTVGSFSTPTVNSLGTTTENRTPAISWSAVTGATRYELWVNHEGVTNRVIHETTLTGTSFTPSTGLAAGNYRIWVKAIGSNGTESSWSAPIQVAIT